MLSKMGTLIVASGTLAMAAAAPEGFQPRLLQVRLGSAGVVAGKPLQVQCWWQNAGAEPAEGGERFFVHVRRAGEAEDAPNAVRFGADHDPPVPAHRWRAGQVLTDSFVVPIPEKTPPGEYVLLLGLYDAATGERGVLDLPLPPNEDSRRYLVARFRVLPAGADADTTPVTHSFAPLPAPGEAPPPPAPARTITLGTGALTLELDAECPRPVAWRLGGAELAGDPDLGEPDVHILSTVDNRVRFADAKPYAISWALARRGGRATYRAEVTRDGQPCVAFDLSFVVNGTGADVVLENVIEQNETQLVRVQLPRLISAREGARLALPYHAGRLIDPVRCAPGERTLGLDWVSQALAGVLHDRHLLCAADMPGVDDLLVATVGEGWAGLGAAFQHREPARPPVPSLLLSERSSIRLRFRRPTQGEPHWTDGARILRARIQARPPDLYNHTVIYKIFCDSPGARQFTTFAQALDLVRRIHHLTDGAPQVAYLVGWQHTGHDTGYPDVFTVNARLGGLDGLKAAMAGASKLNAVLSFHDNYDDAYEHSPAWGAAPIARDASGGPMKGGVGAGGQSYILSFGKPATAQALERVRRTLAMLPVRKSYHIDVLSVVPRRRDFNPQCPTSGAGTVEGKTAIVEELNRHGVDVTSEGLCAPFVGVIGHGWHLMRRHDALFPGEERIPFTPFVYHGHATWGGARPSNEDIPDALLYGATFSADFAHSTPLAQILDSYYLLQAPFLLLRRREMTGYTAGEGKRRADYGRDTYVEVDDAGRHYRVVVDGRPVSQDFTAFVQAWRGDAWLAYSRAGGALEYPAPAGWSDASRVRAVSLTPEGPGAPVAAALSDGRLRLTVPAATPVRVTYAAR